MADNWSGESGILRKTKTCEADELLVFGYSCKLFRDDEKALLIDQGKHLIPWMGDESLKIDRYDGRGALYDLGRYEAPPGGFSTHWTGLSEDEQRAEQLCDEERYHALYHNESEEEVYREEELKRLHQDYAGTYGRVPYSYDGQNDQVAADNINEEVATEDNQPFVPPAHLDIPVNMVLPDTVKLNAIIEKTAMFINQQGTQMEILLKAKQKNNPQFEFLNHDCPLYRYYRHLLMAMKTGRYKPAIEQTPEEETHMEEEESTDYLHPSLASNFTKPDVAPPPRPLPPIVYKPSANCAYSMLVSKIKGTSSNMTEPVIQEEQSNPSDQTTASYDNYYYSDEYRQYYMQCYMNQYANNMEISRAPVIYNTDTQEHNGFQESYDPEKPTTSEHIMIGPQIPAKVNDSVVTTSEKESTIKDAVLKDDQKANDSKSAEKNSKKKKIVIGALAQYCNSDSESDSDEEQESGSLISKHNPSSNDINKINNKVIIVPSDDTKVIIHKMASYVAKNGREFEQIVSSKGDPRFKFLQSYHEYHPYYLEKLQGYLGPERVLENNIAHNQNPKSPRKTPLKSKVIGPVSFSIKKTKDTEALPLKPALSIESSSDEDADKKDAAENLNADSQLTENDTTKLAEEQESDTVKPQDSNAEVQNDQVDDKINIVEETTTIESYTDEISEGIEQEGIKEDESPISDSKENEQDDDDIVEISSEELLESKPIENILREKLAVMQQKSSKNNEKQLQLERKKRALAFLNQLKATSDIPKQIEIEHSEEQEIISYDYNSSDSNISLIEKLDSPRVIYTEQQVQNNNHKRRSRTRSRSRSERREKKKTRKRSNSRSSIEYSPRRHRDGREKSRKSKKKSRSHSHDNKRSSKKRSKNYTDSY